MNEKLFGNDTFLLSVLCLEERAKIGATHRIAYHKLVSVSVYFRIKQH